MSESKDVTLGRVIRKILLKEVTFIQKCGVKGRKMEPTKGTEVTWHSGHLRNSEDQHGWSVLREGERMT